MVRQTCNFHSHSVMRYLLFHLCYVDTMYKTPPMVTRSIVDRDDFICDEDEDVNEDDDYNDNNLIRFRFLILYGLASVTPYDES